MHINHSPVTHSDHSNTHSRPLRHTAALAAFGLSLLCATPPAHAQDASGSATGDRTKSPITAAQLNAFGCVGINGAPFAGRYQSIDVFSDLAALSVRRPDVEALVVGKLVAGLFPPMLSAALVRWTASWEQADNSFLLHGTALRPDGAQLLVRLRLPRAAGVYEAVIRTDNLTSGESTQESIVCTVR